MRKIDENNFKGRCKKKEKKMEFRNNYILDTKSDVDIFTVMLSTDRDRRFELIC